MNSAATRLFEYKSIFFRVALTLRLMGLGYGLGGGASALAPRRRMPVLAILLFIVYCLVAWDVGAASTGVFGNRYGFTGPWRRHR